MANNPVDTTFILSDVCRVESSAQTTCFPPRREHNDLAYPYDLNGRIAPTTSAAKDSAGPGLACVNFTDTRITTIMTSCAISRMRPKRVELMIISSLMDRRGIFRRVGARIRLMRRLLMHLVGICV